MKAIFFLAISIMGLSVSFSGSSAAAQIKQATKPGPAQSISAQMKKMMAAYDAGNFERAMDLCQNVLAADPKNLTAHYFLGNICVKTNHIRDAIAEYNYCLRWQTSPEAAYARQAIEQIKQQRNSRSAARSGGGGGGNNGASLGRMVGSNKSTEDYIQEQSDLLLKEAKEKVAVKQRILDDKVAQIQEEMQQQTANLPRVGGRRVAAQEAKTEAQDQIKQDGQRRIDQLKKDFQSEADEINQSCQNRISGLADHYHNMDRQSVSGSGGR